MQTHIWFKNMDKPIHLFHCNEEEKFLIKKINQNQPTTLKKTQAMLYLLFRKNNAVKSTTSRQNRIKHTVYSNLCSFVIYAGKLSIAEMWMKENIAWRRMSLLICDKIKVGNRSILRQCSDLNKKSPIGVDHSLEAQWKLTSKLANSFIPLILDLPKWKNKCNICNLGSCANTCRLWRFFFPEKSIAHLVPSSYYSALVLLIVTFVWFMSYFSLIFLLHYVAFHCCWIGFFNSRCLSLLFFSLSLSLFYLLRRVRERIHLSRVCVCRVHKVLYRAFIFCSSSSNRCHFCQLYRYQCFKWSIFAWNTCTMRWQAIDWRS